LKTHLWKTLAIAALPLALGGTRAAAQTPQTAQLDPALSVATFDSTWSTINRTLWDTTFNGVDWNAVRGELRPRAQAAKTNQELRAILGDMLGRLKLSHFGIIPGDVQDQLDTGERGPGAAGDAGVEQRLIGDRFVVTRVAEGSAAAAAGVKPGWVIDSVRGRTSAELLKLVSGLPSAHDPRGLQLTAWGAMGGVLSGRAGDTLAVRFLDGADRPVQTALVLRPTGGATTKLGNLPEITVHLDRERVRLDDGTTVGVIRFNYWFPVIAREMDRAIDELRDTDGIVVDMRGNLGGVGFMAAGYAGHFIDRADTLGTMKTRQNSLHFAINPRRVDTQARPVRPFAGPVAILTDAVSVSTAEFFAGGMQKLGRARVFGETSAGQALPSYAKRLPNGDVLLHAVADFTGPGGVRWEGTGVIPDVPAPPTREALLAGGDPALDAATRWIREQKNK
jgi:carboxyl-terminal processing protease